jgi:hydroxymethylglutaryl-CoA reductase
MVNKQKTAKTSRIPGFYKSTPNKRLDLVGKLTGLNDLELADLSKTGALGIEQADRMIENVIGTFELPLGIATNFRINGQDYLVPMAIEEPSVVAAASNGAKMARERGGFKATSTEPIMIGQIQVLDIPDIKTAEEEVLKQKRDILDLANEQDPILVNLGGGAKDVEVRRLSTKAGLMLVVHLHVNCRDAMGANAVNTMCEAIAPKLEELTGGKACLRIISNLAVHRLARAEAVFAAEALGGPEVVDGILNAYAFAETDTYRCATHNKGIMNGIDAVAIATGNDYRAIEAGAHAYAALGGGYSPLTSYEKNKAGDLIGRIEIPMAVGLIGGATSVHPVAKACIKILGVKTAKELGEVMAAVGLAQNLAALRALATEGIQRGHMSLHARNIAIMAGAEGELIDEVVKRLIEEKKVRLDRAREILSDLKKSF